MPETVMTTRELPAQDDVRTAAGMLDAPLWRNNNGSFYNGMRQVRFGLGNDSKAVNEVMKSSDLIGITPRLIMPGDVGRIMGIFTAVEMKAPDWHMIPSDHRAAAQLNFIEVVKRHGGFAGFARSVDEYRKIIGR
jgi:hypothetical protein